jgi:hypothetical protein
MGMKKVCLGLSVAALATIANANLITNGSFEDPDVGGGWGLFTTIPGWTAVGTFPIEIGHASVYGVTNNHLDQVMEMDSTGNSIVQQILGTSTGTSYDLAFGVARRSGVSATDCRVEVYWNGGLLTTIDRSTCWAAYRDRPSSSAAAAPKTRWEGWLMTSFSWQAILSPFQSRSPWR